MGALVGIVVFQWWEMEGLKHPPRPPLPYKIGETLPPFTLKTPEGQTVRVDWTGPGPTVLYVLRPDCVWCARNLASLRALRGAATSYRFIGVSLPAAGLREYLEQTQLGFPVYAVPDMKSVRALRLNATPETIVVSPSGIIQKVWLGAYSKKVRKDVEATFGVKLPDIEVKKVSVPSKPPIAAASPL
jgi:peroxiredoxin